MLMLVYDNHKSFLNWLLMLSNVIGTINFVQLVSLQCAIKELRIWGFFQKVLETLKWKQWTSKVA